MASPVGGQFLFDKPGGTVSIGLVKQGQTSPIPASGSTVAGAVNIEIFAGLSTLPTKFDGNYNQGALVGDTVAGDTAPDLVNGLLTGRTLTLAAGDYRVTNENNNTTGVTTLAGAGGPALIQAGSGNQSVVGAAGDTLIGGSGNQLLDGTAGNQQIQLGSGIDTVFGGKGDTVVSGTGATTASGGQIVGTAGNMLININTLGSYTISLAAGDTVIGKGSAASATISTTNKSLVDLTGDTGAVMVLAGDTLNGGATVIGGSNTTVVGAPADSIVGGAAGLTTAIDPQRGGISIVVGAGNIFAAGGDTVAGKRQIGANDTVTAQSNSTATVTVAAGSKNVVNLSGSSVTGTVFANNGGAASTVAAGVSITGGGGNLTVDGSGGGVLLNLGTAGANVTGTTVAGAATGDTIVGNKSATAASLNFNVNATGTGAGDFVNLNGFGGTATINAFSVTGGVSAVADTVMAGSGSDTVNGGANDRIGVGSVGGGSHVFRHGTTDGTGATTVAGSVLFGTFDTVATTTYVTTPGSVGASPGAGASNATVEVDFFNKSTDGIFYQNENATTSSNIIATATTTTVQGQASTVLTLPDGTKMTLVGVTGLTTSIFKP